MQRILIAIGLVIILVGLAWPLIGRLGLGRLPGDFVIEGRNTRFYFPLATSIVISVVLSAILYLISRWRG